MGLLSILKRGSKNPPPPRQLDEKHDTPDALSSSPSSSEISSSDSDKYAEADLHRPQLSYRPGTSSYTTRHEDDSYDSEVADECLEMPSSPDSLRISRQPRKQDATQMMAEAIYRRASVVHQWFSAPAASGVFGNVNTGLALRGKNGEHILYPHACSGLQDFGWAISHLNPAVGAFDVWVWCGLLMSSVPLQIAMKLDSSVAQTIMSDFV